MTMYSCEVIPFPSTRRVRQIKNLARLMAGYGAAGAERTLRHQLERQAEIMLRKGIAPEVVKREVQGFEVAVRAQLWAIVMQGGDAA
jgi:hypothetical protein